MSVPAGWHPDPSNPNQQRWWDREKWTEGTRGVITPPGSRHTKSTASTAGSNSNYLPSLIAALAASVGIIVGSIGPWMTFMALSKNGVEGDGLIMLILGAISAAALFTLLVRGGKAGFVHRWISTAVGVVCLVIAIVDIMDVASRTTELFGREVGAQVGWGLWMAALSAAALCLTASTVAKHVKKR